MSKVDPQKQLWINGLAGSFMAGLILGIVVLIPSRLLFDFPPWPKRHDQEGLLGMLIFVLSWAVGSAVAYILLARRHPGTVRFGLIMIQVVSILLLITGIVMGVVTLMQRANR